MPLFPYLKNGVKFSTSFIVLGRTMRENGASQVVQWQRICLPAQEMRCDPWVGKILWSRKWLPTPVFLPGEYSSIHSWWIPWREEPGRLQSMGLHRVRHDWAINTHKERPYPRDRETMTEIHGNKLTKGLSSDFSTLGFYSKKKPHSENTWHK